MFFLLSTFETSNHHIVSLRPTQREKCSIAPIANRLKFSFFKSILWSEAPLGPNEKSCIVPRFFLARPRISQISGSLFRGQSTYPYALSALQTDRSLRVCNRLRCPWTQNKLRFTKQTRWACRCVCAAYGRAKVRMGDSFSWWPVWELHPSNQVWQGSAIARTAHYTQQPCLSYCSQKGNLTEDTIARTK